MKTYPDILDETIELSSPSIIAPTIRFYLEFAQDGESLLGPNLDSFLSTMRSDEYDLQLPKSLAYLSQRLWKLERQGVCGRSHSVKFLGSMK